MRFWVALLLCGILTVQLAGCGGAKGTQPTTAVDSLPSSSSAPPHPVAPENAIANGQANDDVEARLLAVLQTTSPEQAFAKKDNWGIPGVALYCTGTTPANPEEVVLACQWGKGYNVMVEGHILVWREGGLWKSQPYPQEALRGVGYFQRLYRQGDRLIAVLNVARGMTAVLEQVQVLRWVGRWEIAWLPDESIWTKGHATVVFNASSYDRFTVETDSYGLPDAERGPFGESNAGDHRLFREEWAKDQLGYVRVSRTEIPTEYGAVVHFVWALVRGDDIEAEHWASNPEIVSRAKQLGLLDSAAKGYFTRREGSTVNGWGPDGPVFRLYTNDYSESPQWVVKVEKQGDRWLVYDIH